MEISTSVASLIISNAIRENVELLSQGLTSQLEYGKKIDKIIRCLKALGKTSQDLNVHSRLQQKRQQSNSKFSIKKAQLLNPHLDALDLRIFYEIIQKIEGLNPHLDALL